MKKHLVTLSLSALLAACATHKNDDFLDSLAKKPTPQILTETDWLIIAGHTFNDNDVRNNLDDLLPDEGARAVVSFKQNGQLSIHGGCNTLMGSWSLSDNTIRVSELASTKKSCDTPLMKLDDAAQSLFANKTITARIPNGIDNSLIRMQTNDNIYYVMQSMNNMQKNNKSYAGKYFSDNVFQNYEWKLSSVFERDNTSIIANSILRSTTLSQENDNLVVRSSCGTTVFNMTLIKNDLNIGNVVSSPEACKNINDGLANRHFVIKGEMIGKKPEINLINNDGDMITLKGSKKKIEKK